ncbi:MAG: hypothetical protein RBR22_11630 [Desulfuromonas sp.]|nr:hypothetical protein [Desulfuromonas sp.]
MARMYCRQCGSPLAKRSTVCIQCDTPVPEGQVDETRSKSALEWLAICCVALSCLVFVVALGMTNLFRDGGWPVGAGSLVAIVLSICWITKLENCAESSVRPDSTRR